MAKIQRWIQSKFLDAAGAVRAWRDTTGYPASLKCFRRVSALVRATIKNGNVVSPLSRFNLLDKKHWHPKIKSVFSQLSHLLCITGLADK